MTKKQTLNLHPDQRKFLARYRGLRTQSETLLNQYGAVAKVADPESIEGRCLRMDIEMMQRKYNGFDAMVRLLEYQGSMTDAEKERMATRLALGDPDAIRLWAAIARGHLMPTD